MTATTLAVLLSLFLVLSVFFPSVGDVSFCGYIPVAVRNVAFDPRRCFFFARRRLLHRSRNVWLLEPLGS